MSWNLWEYFVIPVLDQDILVPLFHGLTMADDDISYKEDHG